MEKMKGVDQKVIEEEGTFGKIIRPDFKKFLHFVSQAQGIIGFYQPRKNKQEPNKDAGSGYQYFHNVE